MKILKFALALIATVLLTWVLNTSFAVGKLRLPAFGGLLSPFQGYWQNGEPLTGDLTHKTFKDLKGNAQVVYDNRMVPHIFAENLEDAYFIQGYLHASNRLWQMDFITHAAAGRLSELVGNAQLRPNLTSIDLDKLNRRRGIAKGAENTVEKWKNDKETNDIANAYCAGANSYISSLKPEDYPVEYKILGVQPEAWSPLKMALLAKYMAMDLAMRDDDIETTNAKTLFGADFDAVYPAYFPEQSPVVPSGTPWKSASSASKTASTEGGGKLSFLPFEAHEEAKPNPSNGSNNWAVSGKKTRNGHPILCGDPHLGLRLPSIWYEVQINTPDMNVYGVSLPGLPAVVIGFNDNIAWTMTNVGHDVADWFSIKWKDNTKAEYMLDGKYLKTDLRIEEIKIKEMPSLFDTVRYTAWGPVVYENDTMPKANMAFHWLANIIPETTIKTFKKLNKAKNYDEYSEAISEYNVPAQNFAFACKDGDIALKVMGLFPKRAKGQGRFVQDGSSSANDWQGYVPKDQVPQYRNPARGYVASANQHSTDPTYPHHYISENFDMYRGRTVNKMLDTMRDITVDHMMLMQASNFSLQAQEALPLMLKNLDENAVSTEGGGILNELKNWNYYFDADKTAPIYFEEWLNAFHKATWDEVYNHKKESNILKPKAGRTIFLLRDDPKSKFFDNQATADVKESAKEILTASFKTMVAEIARIQTEITAKYPENPTLTWSHYKDTEVPHISNIPGFGRYHLPNGGNGRSLNATTKNHGPSWRMIVELGDTVKAWVVYPGGQSGNPGSKHYADFIDAWADGAYYRALFMKKADDKDERIAYRQEFKRQ
jgi:penicillin amidase